MPKFLTYQRPAAVNKQVRAGKPGVTYGKPGKQMPRGAPKPAQPQHPVLDIKLPDLLRKE
jgi:hypothetical protein